MVDLSICKIIIEGPDRVGKDTIIGNIIKEYKKSFVYLHHYANPTGNEHWGKDQYNNMFELFHSNRYIIANRAHGGEVVYPKLYHGYDGNYVYNIEKKFNTYNILLIVLIDEPENLISRDDGLSFSTDLEMKRKEIELFKEFYEDSNIKNKMLINIKDLDEDQVKAKVFKKINDTKQWRNYRK
jgi:thymidylate kinase